MFNAVGVNLVAYAVSMIAAFAIGISGFLTGVPVVMVAVYCLFVGFYVRTQIRKGLRRRAVLAGSIAAILVVFAAMNLNIA